MAEKIISPGVFTNEIDQSFLPAAIGPVGAAVVGPTVKGPAKSYTFERPSDIATCPIKGRTQVKGGSGCQSIQRGNLPAYGW